jgi:hypothetical protein
MLNGTYGKDTTLTDQQSGHSWLDNEDDNEELDAIAEEMFKPSAQRDDPFADERMPFIGGELKDLKNDIAEHGVWLTILAVREGESKGNGKIKGGPQWYIDVRVKHDHPNFAKLRDSDALLDYCGTISFAKNGKEGKEIASRTTQFTKVATMLPYSYVTLDRSGDFDKFRTVK